MLIDNPEALKEWLTAILEPMCDADPNALAKYVIALVKKDKPMNELRDTCLDQLDVFLQHETKPFVELLFKALDDKSYLVKSEFIAQPSAQVDLPSIEVSPAFANNTVGSNPAINNLNNNNELDSNRAVSPTNATLPVTLTSPTALASKVGGGLSTSGSKVTERRSSRPESNVTEIEDRDSKRPIRKPTGNRSRSRSRSPSWNRNRSRSRSRDRDERRPRRGYPDDDRRFPDRRRIMGGRRYDRYNDYRGPDRNRDRLERKRSRTRSRSPKSRSRSRSTSPTRNKDRDRQRVDGVSRAHSPHPQDHGDKDYRFNSSSVSVGSQPSVPSGTSPSNTRGPASIDNAQPAVRNPRRCRDYDEKGYCMRGDLCPFDHGADPVVVEEVHLPNVLAYGPGGGTAGSSGPVPGPVPRPTVPPPGSIPPLLGHPMGHPRPIPPPPLHQMPGPRHFPHIPDPYIPEPYNPEAPGLDRMPPRLRPPFWGPRMMLGHRAPRPPMSFMHATRELINVPTVDCNVSNNSSSNNRIVVPPQMKPSNDNVSGPHQQRIFRNMGGNNLDPMGKRRPFDYNRLGTRNKFKLDNAVLELRKIPHGLNGIAQLNNHFSKFGRIVNLQVCYEGDPEAALIQFSSHAEAHAAYRSTEAVLNNRFIKVFWHNKDTPTEASPSVTVPAQEDEVQSAKKLSAKERLGVPVAGQYLDGNANASSVAEEATEKSSVILAASGILSKTVFNPAALKKTNVVANSVLQPNSAKVKGECLTAHETIKKKQEEQRKEAFKIKADLMKREQELYVKQLQQQKLLIEKLEKNKGMTSAERSSIMTTVKVLQESIERLKIGLETASSHPKTKQEAQKEILDIEMELYNRQHSGADTSELRRKVAELKQEAVSMGLIDRIPIRGGRGILRKVVKGVRGGFRGRGRRGGVMRSVDHRPRKLKIIGFADEERNDVITHLAQYGEIDNVGPEDDHLKLFLTFKTRRDAELAVVQGAKYKDRTLSMEWQPNMVRRSSLAGDASVDGLQDGLVLDEELLDPDEDLLLGDDEEEEDSEARSWRR